MLKTVRDFAVSAALIIGSSIIALVLVELFLRMYPGFLPEGVQIRLHNQDEGRGTHSSHRYIGFVPQPDDIAPGSDATSASAEQIWASRNSTPWPKQADIIVIGDSFSYSQMATRDQAWTYLLDQHSHNNRVITLGTIGSGPQQYLRTLETYGLPLSPKLVIVGLFLGNDMRDAELFDDWWNNARDEDFRVFRSEARSQGSDGLLYRIARATYIGWTLAELRRSLDEGRFLSGETLELESGEKVQLVPRALLQNIDDAAEGKHGFNLVVDTLKRIDALAEANGASCLVLFFPRKEEIYWRSASQELPNLPAPVIEELEKDGIAYLDLGPVMRDQALNGKALYLEVDGHLTPLGYSLVADTVNDFLVRHGSALGVEWDKEPASADDIHEYQK